MGEGRKETEWQMGHVGGENNLKKCTFTSKSVVFMPSESVTV